MSEASKMPARIWAGGDIPFRHWSPYPPRHDDDQINTKFIRADIAEQMAEALRVIAGERQCADNLMGNADVARAALSAWEASNPARQAAGGLV